MPSGYLGGVFEVQDLVFKKMRSWWLLVGPAPPARISKVSLVYTSVNSLRFLIPPL